MTKDTIIMSRPQWQESTGSNQRLRDTEEDIDSTELSYRLRMCNGFSHENSTSLINMMEEFTKNPLLKKLGAKGLKKCLPDAIMTFYMYYRGLGEILDNSTYLEKMTDLLAMYTDAEARCWYVRNNHNTDTMSLKDAYEVSSRLHTFYGTVLHNKLDQKLFLLMKCRLIKKEFKTVFNLIFENILLKTDRPSITNEVDYIRYILAYKLWKKLFKLISERKHINELAVKNIEYPELLCKLNKLNNLNSKISYILPSCPRNSKNITLFYMLHKFNVDKACVDYFVCLKNGFGEVNYDKMCSFTEDDTDYENLIFTNSVVDPFDRTCFSTSTLSTSTSASTFRTLNFNSRDTFQTSSTVRRKNNGSSSNTPTSIGLPLGPIVIDDDDNTIDLTAEEAPSNKTLQSKKVISTKLKKHSVKSKKKRNNTIKHTNNIYANDIIDLDSDVEDTEEDKSHPFRRLSKDKCTSISESIQPVVHNKQSIECLEDSSSGIESNLSENDHYDPFKLPQAFRRLYDEYGVDQDLYSVFDEIRFSKVSTRIETDSEDETDQSESRSSFSGSLQGLKESNRVTNYNSSQNNTLLVSKSKSITPVLPQKQVGKEVERDATSHLNNSPANGFVATAAVIDLTDDLSRIVDKTVNNMVGTPTKTSRTLHDIHEICSEVSSVTTEDNLITSEDSMALDAMAAENFRPSDLVDYSIGTPASEMDDLEEDVDTPFTTYINDDMFVESRDASVIILTSDDSTTFSFDLRSEACTPTRGDIEPAKSTNLLQNFKEILAKSKHEITNESIQSITTLNSVTKMLAKSPTDNDVISDEELLENVTPQLQTDTSNVSYENTTNLVESIPVSLATTETYKSIFSKSFPSFEQVESSMEVLPTTTETVAADSTLPTPKSTISDVDSLREVIPEPSEKLKDSHAVTESMNEKLINISLMELEIERELTSISDLEDMEELKTQADTEPLNKPKNAEHISQAVMPQDLDTEDKIPARRELQSASESLVNYSFMELEIERELTSVSEPEVTEGLKGQTGKVFNNDESVNDQILEETLLQHKASRDLFLHYGTDQQENNIVHHKSDTILSDELEDTLELVANTSIKSLENLEIVEEDFEPPMIVNASEITVSNTDNEEHFISSEVIAHTDLEVHEDLRRMDDDLESEIERSQDISETSCAIISLENLSESSQKNIVVEEIETRASILSTASNIDVIEKFETISDRAYEVQPQFKAESSIAIPTEKDINCTNIQAVNKVGHTEELVVTEESESLCESNEHEICDIELETESKAQELPPVISQDIEPVENVGTVASEQLESSVNNFDDIISLPSKNQSNERLDQSVHIATDNEEETYSKELKYSGSAIAEEQINVVAPDCTPAITVITIEDSHNTRQSINKINDFEINEIKEETIPKFKAQSEAVEKSIEHSQKDNSKNSSIKCGDLEQNEAFTIFSKLETNLKIQGQEEEFHYGEDVPEETVSEQLDNNGNNVLPCVNSDAISQPEEIKTETFETGEIIVAETPVIHSDYVLLKEREENIEVTSPKETVIHRNEYSLENELVIEQEAEAQGTKATDNVFSFDQEHVAVSDAKDYMSIESGLEIVVETEVIDSKAADTVFPFEQENNEIIPQETTVCDANEYPSMESELVIGLEAEAIDSKAAESVLSSEQEINDFIPQETAVSDANEYPSMESELVIRLEAEAIDSKAADSVLSSEQEINEIIPQEATVCDANEYPSMESELVIGLEAEAIDSKAADSVLSSEQEINEIIPQEATVCDANEYPSMESELVIGLEAEVIDSKAAESVLPCEQEINEIIPQEATVCDANEYPSMESELVIGLEAEAIDSKAADSVLSSEQEINEIIPQETTVSDANEYPSMESELVIGLEAEVIDSKAAESVLPCEQENNEITAASENNEYPLIQNDLLIEVEAEVINFKAAVLSLDQENIEIISQETAASNANECPSKENELIIQVEPEMIESKPADSVLPPEQENIVIISEKMTVSDANESSLIHNEPKIESGLKTIASKTNFLHSDSVLPTEQENIEVTPEEIIVSVANEISLMHNEPKSESELEIVVAEPQILFSDSVLQVQENIEVISEEITISDTNQFQSIENELVSEVEAEVIDSKTSDSVLLSEQSTAVSVANDFSLIENESLRVEEEKILPIEQTSTEITSEEITISDTNVSSIIHIESEIKPELETVSQVEVLHSNSVLPVDQENNEVTPDELTINGASKCSIVENESEIISYDTPELLEDSCVEVVECEILSQKANELNKEIQTFIACRSTDKISEETVSAETKFQEIVDSESNRKIAETNPMESSNVIESVSKQLSDREDESTDENINVVTVDVHQESCSIKTTDTQLMDTKTVEENRSDVEGAKEEFDEQVQLSQNIQTDTESKIFEEEIHHFEQKSPRDSNTDHLQTEVEEKLLIEQKENYVRSTAVVKREDNDLREIKAVCELIEKVDNPESAGTVTDLAVETTANEQDVLHFNIKSVDLEVSSTAIESDETNQEITTEIPLVMELNESEDIGKCVVVNINEDVNQEITRNILIEDKTCKHSENNLLEMNVIQNEEKNNVKCNLIEDINISENQPDETLVKHDNVTSQILVGSNVEKHNLINASNETSEVIENVVDIPIIEPNISLKNQDVVIKMDDKECEEISTTENVITSENATSCGLDVSESISKGSVIINENMESVTNFEVSNKNICESNLPLSVQTIQSNSNPVNDMSFFYNIELMSLLEPNNYKNEFSKPDYTLIVGDSEDITFKTKTSKMRTKENSSNITIVAETSVPEVCNSVIQTNDFKQPASSTKLRIDVDNVQDESITTPSEKNVPLPSSQFDFSNIGCDKEVIDDIESKSFPEIVSSEIKEILLEQKISIIESNTENDLNPVVDMSLEHKISNVETSSNIFKLIEPKANLLNTDKLCLDVTKTITPNNKLDSKIGLLTLCEAVNNLHSDNINVLDDLKIQSQDCIDNKNDVKIGKTKASSSRLNIKRKRRKGKKRFTKVKNNNATNKKCNYKSKRDDVIQVTELDSKETQGLLVKMTKLEGSIQTKTTQTNQIKSNLLSADLDILYKKVSVDVSQNKKRGRKPSKKLTAVLQNSNINPEPITVNKSMDKSTIEEPIAATIQKLGIQSKKHEKKKTKKGAKRVIEKVIEEAIGKITTRRKSCINYNEERKFQETFSPRRATRSQTDKPRNKNNKKSTNLDIVKQMDLTFSEDSVDSIPISTRMEIENRKKEIKAIDSPKKNVELLDSSNKSESADILSYFCLQPKPSAGIPSDISVVNSALNKPELLVKESSRTESIDLADEPAKKKDELNDIVNEVIVERKIIDDILLCKVDTSPKIPLKDGSERKELVVEKEAKPVKLKNKILKQNLETKLHLTKKNVKNIIHPLQTQTVEEKPVVTITCVKDKLEEKCANILEPIDKIDITVTPIAEVEVTHWSQSNLDLLAMASLQRREKELAIQGSKETSKLSKSIERIYQQRSPDKIKLVPEKSQSIKISNELSITPITNQTTKSEKQRKKNPVKKPYSLRSSKSSFPISIIEETKPSDKKRKRSKNREVQSASILNDDIEVEVLPPKKQLKLINSERTIVESTNKFLQSQIKASTDAPIGTKRNRFALACEIAEQVSISRREIPLNELPRSLPDIDNSQLQLLCKQIENNEEILNKSSKNLTKLSTNNSQSNVNVGERISNRSYLDELKDDDEELIIDIEAKSPPQTLDAPKYRQNIEDIVSKLLKRKEVESIKSITETEAPVIISPVLNLTYTEIKTTSAEITKSETCTQKVNHLDSAQLITDDKQKCCKAENMSNSINTESKTVNSNATDMLKMNKTSILLVSPIKISSTPPNLEVAINKDSDITSNNTQSFDKNTNQTIGIVVPPKDALNSIPEVTNSTITHSVDNSVVNNLKSIHKGQECIDLKIKTNNIDHTSSSSSLDQVLLNLPKFKKKDPLNFMIVPKRKSANTSEKIKSSHSNVDNFKTEVPRIASKICVPPQVIRKMEIVQNVNENLPLIHRTEIVTSDPVDSKSLDKIVKKKDLISPVKSVSKDVMLELSTNDEEKVNKEAVHEVPEIKEDEPLPLIKSNFSIDKLVSLVTESFPKNSPKKESFELPNQNVSPHCGKRDMVKKTYDHVIKQKIMSTLNCTQQENQLDFCWTKKDDLQLSIPKPREELDVLDLTVNKSDELNVTLSNDNIQSKDTINITDKCPIKLQSEMHNIIDITKNVAEICDTSMYEAISPSNGRDFCSDDDLSDTNLETNIEEKQLSSYAVDKKLINKDGVNFLENKKQPQIINNATQTEKCNDNLVEVFVPISSPQSVSTISETSLDEMDFLPTSNKIVSTSETINSLSTSVKSADCTMSSEVVNNHNLHVIGKSRGPSITVVKPVDEYPKSKKQCASTFIEHKGIKHKIFVISKNTNQYNQGKAKPVNFSNVTDDTNIKKRIALESNNVEKNKIQLVPANKKIKTDEITNQISDLSTSASLSTDRIKVSDTIAVPHLELFKQDVTVLDSAKFIQVESMSSLPNNVNFFENIERTKESLLNEQAESKNAKLITPITAKKSANFETEAKDTLEVHAPILTKPERFKKRARIIFDTNETLKPDLVTNLKIPNENKSIKESVPINTEKKLKTFPPAIKKPQIYKPKLQLKNDYFVEPMIQAQNSVIVSQEIPEDSAKSTLIIAPYTMVSDLLQTNPPEGSNKLETAHALKENISEVTLDSTTTKKAEIVPYKLLIPKKRNILSDSSLEISPLKNEESNTVEQAKSIVSPEIGKQEDKIVVTQKSNKPLSLKARWLLNSTKNDNQYEAEDSESNLQTQNKMELKTYNNKMDAASMDVETCNKPPILPDIGSVLESTPALEQSQNDDVSTTTISKMQILDNIVQKNQSELCMPLIPNQEESISSEEKHTDINKFNKSTENELTCVTFSQDQCNTVTKNVEENLKSIVYNNRCSPPSKQRSKKKTDFTSIKSLSSPYMNTTDKPIDDDIQNISEIAVEIPSELINTVDLSVLHKDINDKPMESDNQKEIICTVVLPLDSSPTKTVSSVAEPSDFANVNKLQYTITEPSPYSDFNNSEKPMESDNEKKINSTVAIPLDSSPTKTVSSVAEPSDLANVNKLQYAISEPMSLESVVENQEVASHSGVSTITSAYSDLNDSEKPMESDNEKKIYSTVAIPLDSLPTKTVSSVAEPSDLANVNKMQYTITETGSVESAVENQEVASHSGISTIPSAYSDLNNSEKPMESDNENKINSTVAIPVDSSPTKTDSSVAEPSDLANVNKLQYAITEPSSVESAVENQEVASHSGVLTITSVYSDLNNSEKPMEIEKKINSTVIIPLDSSPTKTVSSVAEPSDLANVNKMQYTITETGSVESAVENQEVASHSSVSTLSLPYSDLNNSEKPMESDNENKINSTVAIPVDSSPTKTDSSVAEPSDLANVNKLQYAITEPMSVESVVENQEVASHSGVSTLSSPCSDLNDSEKYNRMDSSSTETIETLSPEKDIEEFEAVLKSVESGKDSCEYDKINHTTDILQEIVDMEDTNDENAANKSNSKKEDFTKLIMEDTSKHISELSNEVLTQNENFAECENRAPSNAAVVQNESSDGIGSESDTKKDPFMDFLEDPSKFEFEDTLFENMSELLDNAPFLDDLINFCDFEEICAIANDKLCLPLIKDRERDCMIGGVPMPSANKNDIIAKREISYLNELSPLVSDELSNFHPKNCMAMETIQPKIRSDVFKNKRELLNLDEEEEVEERVHEISLCVRTQVRNSKSTSHCERHISHIYTETLTERTLQELIASSGKGKLLPFKNYDNSFIDICAGLNEYIPKPLLTLIQKRYENNLVEVLANARKAIINSDNYLVDLNKSTEQNQSAISASNLPLDSVDNKQRQMPFATVIAAPSNYNNAYIPHNQPQLATSISPLMYNNAYTHQNQEVPLVVCNDQIQLPLSAGIISSSDCNSVYNEQNQIQLATAIAAPSSYINVCNDQNQLPLPVGIAASSSYINVCNDQNQIPLATAIAAPSSYINVCNDQNQLPLPVGIAASSSYINVCNDQNQIPLPVGIAASSDCNSVYNVQNQIPLASAMSDPSDYNNVYTGQNQIPLSYNAYIQQNQGLQATVISPLNYNGCTVYNQIPTVPSSYSNVCTAYNQTPIFHSTYNDVCATENIQETASLPSTQYSNESDMEIKKRKKEEKKVSKEENQIKKSKCFETYKKLKLLNEKKKTQPVKVVTPLRNITPSRVPASKRKVALPCMENNTIKQVQNTQVNDKVDKSQTSSLKIVPIKHVPLQDNSNHFKILDMPDLLSPPCIDVDSQIKSPKNVNLIHDNSSLTKDIVPKGAMGTPAPVEMTEETQVQFPLSIETTPTLEPHSAKNSNISETKNTSFSDGNKNIEEGKVHSEHTVTDHVENNKSPCSQEAQNTGDNITKPDLKRKVAVLYNQKTNLLLNPVKEEEEPVIKKPKLTNEVITDVSSASSDTLSLNIKPSPKAKIDSSPRSDDLTPEETQLKTKDIHTKEDDIQPKEDDIQTKEDGVQTKQEDLYTKKIDINTKEENILTKGEKSSVPNISKLEKHSKISTDLIKTSLPKSLPKNMSPREITQPISHISSSDTKSPLPPLPQKKTPPSIENSEYVECETLPVLKSPLSKLIYSKKSPSKAEPPKLVLHRSLPESTSVLPISLPQKRSPTTLQPSENLDHAVLPELTPPLPKTVYSKRTPSAVEPPELVLYCSLPELKSPPSTPLLQKRTAKTIQLPQSTVRETSPEVKVQLQKHLPQKRPPSANECPEMKSPLQMPLSPNTSSSLNKRSKLSVRESTTEIKSTAQNPLSQKRTPPTTEGFERVVPEFPPELKSELQNQLPLKRLSPKLVVCGSTSEIKLPPQNPLPQKRTPPTMAQPYTVVHESLQKQLLSMNSPHTNHQSKLLIYGSTSEVKLPSQISLSQKRSPSIAANLNLTVHGTSPEMKSPKQHSLPIKTPPTTNEYQKSTLLTTSLKKNLNSLKILPSSNEHFNNALPGISAEIKSPHQKPLPQRKTSNTAEYIELASSSASPEIRHLPPKRTPPTNEHFKNAMPRIYSQMKSPLQIPLSQRKTPPTPEDLELTRSSASPEIKLPLQKQLPPKRSPPTTEPLKNVVPRISPEMKSPLQMPLPQRKTPPTPEDLELARNSALPEIKLPLQKQLPPKRSLPTTEHLKNVVPRISPEIKSPLQMPLSQRKTPPTLEDLELAKSSTSREIKLPLQKQLPPKRSPPTAEHLKYVVPRISPEIKSPLQRLLPQKKTPPAVVDVEHVGRGAASPEIKLPLQKQLPPKRSLLINSLPEMKSPVEKPLTKMTPPKIESSEVIMGEPLQKNKNPHPKPVVQKRSSPTIEPSESIRPLPKLAYPQQKSLPEKRPVHIPVIPKPIVRFVPKPVPVKTSPPRFSQVYEPTLKPIIADPSFDRYSRESSRSCYSSTKETVHTAAMSHITHVSRTTGAQQISQTTHVSRTMTQELTSRKRQHSEDYDVLAKKLKQDELFDLVKNSENPTFTSFRRESTKLSSSLTSSLASSSKVDYYRFTEESSSTSPLRNRRQQNIPFRSTSNRTSTSATSISARASSSTSTRFGETLHQQSRSIDVNASRRKEEGDGRYMDSFSLSARTTTTSKTFTDRSGKPPVAESPRWDSWDLPNDFSNQAVLEALRNSRHSDDHRKKERKPVYVSDFLRNQSR